MTRDVVAGPLVLTDGVALESDTPSELRDNRARYAAIVFGAAVPVAFIVFLRIGRDVWFWLDEWDLLANRSLNLHDVFAPHAGHLVALPAVVYRALFAVFGLRTYLPYLTLGVIAHIVSAVLLRIVMRRTGVDPWLATAAAGLYLFFGAGGQDIIWGFQLTFVGALAFGLGQLLLVDHDGPVDRRDWFALACGVGALLCSGVAVTMVIVVGLAALVRRSWRVALLQTVPLAFGYLLWELVIGRDDLPAASRQGLLEFERRGIASTFDSLGHVPFIGWVLAAMLVAGLGLAWRQRHGIELLRTSAALPLAMMLGALVFLTITGSTRAQFGINAGSSRYLDIVGALTLPAIALAADAIVRAFHGSRIVTLAVVVLLLVGVPGNLRATRGTLPPKVYFVYSERAVRSMPRLDLAKQVPGNFAPDRDAMPGVSVEWLLNTLRSGRLPGPVSLPPTARATYELRLSLNETGGSVPAACTPLESTVTRVLQTGDTLTVRGAVAVRSRPDFGTPSGWVPYGDSFLQGKGSHRLTAGTGPLVLQFRRAGKSASVCGGTPPSDR